LRLADDQAGLELTRAAGRAAQRGLDNLSLRVDLGRLTGLSGRFGRVLIALLEQRLQRLDNFFGVGPLEYDPFSSVEVKTFVPMV